MGHDRECIACTMGENFESLPDWGVCLETLTAEYVYIVELFNTKTLKALCVQVAR